MMCVFRHSGRHRRSSVHLLRRTGIVAGTIANGTENLVGQNRSVRRECSPSIDSRHYVLSRQALRNISHDRFICLVCLIVFLSYLPGK